MRKTSKLKRIVAGLLALILTVALLPAQTARIAKADPTTGGVSVVDPVKTDPETIDKDKKGSLTIYKYEYGSGTTIGTAPGTGLGGQTIPDGATLIKNVGFTLYKVSDLSTYYKGDTTALPTGVPTAAEIAGYTLVESEKLTDADGKVFWTNLDLGIYYVVESTPPVSATSTPVNFYVSIPMTEVDGTDWLYDVVVYPKNATSYAGVKLKKIGNNTDSNVLQGAKFVLEKQDVIDPSKWFYVKNTGTVLNPVWTYSETNKTNATEFTTDATGIIEINGLSHGTYRFTETYAPDGYVSDETITYQFYIDTDGKVYSDSGKLTEYADKIVKVNNEKPDIDKQVQKADGSWVGDKADDTVSGATTTNTKGSADYSIGDDVSFRIVVDIPSNVDKLKTFKITDTISSGFDLATPPTDFSIKGYDSGDDIDIVAGSTISGVTPTVSGQTWTLDFSTDKSAINIYDKIVISFKAKLNDSATIAGEGNPNDVKLEYSNKITTDQASVDPPKSELTDRVVVYSFSIQLTKSFTGAVADTDYTAKFQLYKRNDASGTETLKFMDGSTVQADKVGTEITVTQNGTTSATHTFTGLENGEYYLVETDTASGYNLLKEPVKVELNLDYTTTITTTTTPDPITGAVTETTTSTTAYKKGGSPVTGDGVKAITEITNSKGFTLPTTGGIGSAIFVFVGVSMMVAAVILFFVSRKKENDKTKP